jgi:hypothetical protein
MSALRLAVARTWSPVPRHYLPDPDSDRRKLRPHRACKLPWRRASSPRRRRPAILVECSSRLFPNEGGHPHDEAQRALGKAKLPAFRLYDLRHTFASLLLAASAPITYVSAQLGHVNPSTTLRYYARWIPNKCRRWVDLLDRVSEVVAAAAEAVSGPIWNQTAPKSQIGHPETSEVPDKIGGPSRTRTLDPLIKSCPEPRTQGTQDDLSRTNHSDPD